jgi:DDE superfamily endonuclease
MPRHSERRYQINKLTEEARHRFSLRSLRDSGALSDDSLEDDLDLLRLLQIRELEATRYFFRSPLYRRCKGNDTLLTELDHDLNIGDSGAWLNESEFLQKYRMTRRSFEVLVTKIEKHPVFSNNTGMWRGGRKQTNPRYQLACFLRYIGSFGCGATSAGLRNIFGYGRGSFPNFLNRIITAIRSFRDEYIQWPDQEERKRIAQRFFEGFDLPNCMGIADGTLFPFARKLETDDAADYNGRKLGYTITCMVVCDDRRLVRYYLSGLPGSVHDNRVFRNTRLCRRPRIHFADREYLIGDSAFENRWFMVSAYKCLPGALLAGDKLLFNTTLGRARVVSEHTIGMLKGRFCWLRCIQRVLKRKSPRQCMKTILRIIDCCFILHNFFVLGGEDDVPLGWIDDDDNVSEIGVPLKETDILNQPIPTWAEGDARRNQLYEWIRENVL